MSNCKCIYILHLFSSSNDISSISLLMSLIFDLVFNFNFFITLIKTTLESKEKGKREKQNHKLKLIIHYVVTEISS